MFYRTNPCIQSACIFSFIKANFDTPAEVYFPSDLILPSAEKDEKITLSSFAWKPK